MKANELMIGDLVRKLERGGHSIPVKIIAIYEHDADYETRDGHTGCMSLNGYEPIPLTNKILEKNGFTCDANGMNDSDELVVSVEYGEYQRNTDDGFKVLADGKAIKYVHELQHALRLCGVEKEIIL